MWRLGPRKGFLKHFCKLFSQNGKLMLKIILFSMFLIIILINIFVFWWFFDYPVFAENQQTKISTQNFFYLMNWDLGHLQWCVDENKIAIRKISIRSIRKLSCFDQQTIVGGPDFNLTNGEISIIFSIYFCKIIFSNNFIISLEFWSIFQLFQPNLRFFSFFIDSNQ